MCCRKKGAFHWTILPNFQPRAGLACRVILWCDPCRRFRQNPSSELQQYVGVVCRYRPPQLVRLHHHERAPAQLDGAIDSVDCSHYKIRADSPYVLTVRAYERVLALDSTMQERTLTA